jgi:hypothetical protein
MTKRIHSVHACRKCEGTLADYAAHLESVAKSAHGSMLRASERTSLFWYVGARDVWVITEARLELLGEYLAREIVIRTT